MSFEELVDWSILIYNGFAIIIAILFLAYLVAKEFDDE